MHLHNITTTDFQSISHVIKEQRIDLNKMIDSLKQSNPLWQVTNALLDEKISVYTLMNLMDSHRLHYLLLFFS